MFASALASEQTREFVMLQERAMGDEGLVSLQLAMSARLAVAERFQSLIDEAQRVFAARQPKSVE